MDASLSQVSAQLCARPCLKRHELEISEQWTQYVPMDGAPKLRPFLVQLHWERPSTHSMCVHELATIFHSFQPTVACCGSRTPRAVLHTSPLGIAKGGLQRSMLLSEMRFSLFFEKPLLPLQCRKTMVRCSCFRGVCTTLCRGNPQCHERQSRYAKFLYVQQVRTTKGRLVTADGALEGSP